MVSIKRQLREDEVLALYRLADVCVVSSLDDGMNLVAKEFLAARNDERGRLLLSEFTGAAWELPNAETFNPFAIDDFARRLYAISTGDGDHSSERIRKMREHVKNHTVYGWFADISRDTAARLIGAMTYLFDKWPSIQARIRAAERVLLMLDFDGTLAPIVARPSEARVPAETLRTLKALRDRKQMELAVISGRGATDVRSLVGLTDIHYFGSHGRERVRPGSTRVETDPRGRTAIAEACQIVAQELAGIDGFHIENKGVSAAAHYRNVDPLHNVAVQRAVRDAVRTVGELQASPRQDGVRHHAA